MNTFSSDGLRLHFTTWTVHENRRITSVLWFNSILQKLTRRRSWKRSRFSKPRHWWLSVPSATSKRRSDRVLCATSGPSICLRSAVVASTRTGKCKTARSCWNAPAKRSPIPCYDLLEVAYWNNSCDHQRQMKVRFVLHALMM